MLLNSVKISNLFLITLLFLSKACSSIFTSGEFRMWLGPPVSILLNSCVSWSTYFHQCTVAKFHSFDYFVWYPCAIQCHPLKAFLSSHLTLRLCHNLLQMHLFRSVFCTFYTLFCLFYLQRQFGLVSTRQSGSPTHPTVTFKLVGEPDQVSTHWY